MTALNTLGILSTSFTWNAFPTVLKEFPHMLSTCWLLFLHSAVQIVRLCWIDDFMGQIGLLYRGRVWTQRGFAWGNWHWPCIRWSGLHNHPTSLNLDDLGWVGLQSEGKAANKCSAYVGTLSRLLENHSRWSWLRECQGCARLSSRKKGGYFKESNITNIFWFVQHFFGYYMIPYVLFHSFEVFTIILQCRK